MLQQSSNKNVKGTEIVGFIKTFEQYPQKFKKGS